MLHAMHIYRVSNCCCWTIRSVISETDDSSELESIDMIESMITDFVLGIPSDDESSSSSEIIIMLCGDFLCLFADSSAICLVCGA